MGEQGTEFHAFEVEDDVEGHLEQRPPLVDGAVEDVEGHKYYSIDGPDEDDVEGHVQPPRGDDADHPHS